MRIVSTKNLKPGMKLGKPIYATDSRLLLTKNTTLTMAYIRNLTSKNIPSVYIEDEISKDIEIESAVDDEVKIEAVNQIKKIFDEISSKNTPQKKSYITTQNYSDMQSLVSNIIDNIMKNNNLLYNLVDTISTDLATYNHMVNTAIMSLMVGKTLGLSKSNLIDLGTGALLHDIGKSQIPHEILNKPSNLTEDEFTIMKDHTILGYLMVKDNGSISAFVKTIILMHHEKLDGSGYPNGIEGKDLNPLVQICSVCDIFDAMITDRVYRDKLPIYKVLETISSDVFTKYTKKIYDALINSIAIFPPGSGIKLSNGEKGIVIKNHYNQPLRPEVRIIYDSDNKLYPDFKVIDLMKNLTLFIEDRVDIEY